MHRDHSVGFHSDLKYLPFLLDNIQLPFFFSFYISQPICIEAHSLMRGQQQVAKTKGKNDKSETVDVLHHFLC